MKFFLIIALFNVISSPIVFCQTKPLEIIFASTQSDTATERNETKVYKLKKKATNSDFDYSKLDDFDNNTNDTLNLKNLMLIFDPIPGLYNYFQFIATFKGYSIQNVEKDFHNILIIKTDSKNTIIDAYLYTLEWAEPPLQLNLYKSDMKNVKLKDNLEISELKMTRKEFWDEEDRIYKGGGKLILE